MKHSLALVFALVVSPASADAPTPDKVKPTDFAAGIALTPKPELAVQTVLLPLEVYRGARADFSDLSVFDAEGHAVPWAIRTVAKLSEVQRREQDVAFFPIYGAKSTQASALALRVERSAEGAVIAVHTPETSAAAQGEKLLAYIVHTGTPSADLIALRFELEPGDTSFVLPVQVEGSDNLSDWQVLSRGEAIGCLAHAGQAVLRQRIGIAPTRAAFLRITWSGELPLRVERMFAEQESVLARSQLAPRHVAVGPLPFKDGSYRLDLGATLALESVSPTLPAGDVLLKAALFIGEDGVQGAQPVFDGQIYRLSHASTALSSAPIALSSQRARVLELRIDTRASEPPTQPLQFDVAYAPDQLLFVAHGSAPHLLAFGSYRAQPAPFTAERLIAFLSPEQRASLPLESAQLGSLKTLGGEAARKAPKAPVATRTLLLWAVLVLGAGTLVALALRLLKKTSGA
jgi:hypothetical protein